MVSTNHFTLEKVNMVLMVLKAEYKRRILSTKSEVIISAKILKPIFQCEISAILF